MNNQPLTREELLEELNDLRVMLQPANSNAVPATAITKALSKIDNVLNAERPPVIMESHDLPRPMNLRAATSDTLVALTWEPIINPNVVGFQILRREIERDPVGRFTVINGNTRNTSNTYMDTEVALGGSYIYRVKCIDRYATLSEWSGYARADLPLPSPRVRVEYPHVEKTEIGTVVADAFTPEGDEKVIQRAGSTRLYWFGIDKTYRKHRLICKPLEPVHPDTEGMFAKVWDNGYGSTDVSRSWDILARRIKGYHFFSYRDGATGNIYRVPVEDILNGQVKEPSPVDAPVEWVEQ